MRRPGGTRNDCAISGRRGGQNGSAGISPSGRRARPPETATSLRASAVARTICAKCAENPWRTACSRSGRMEPVQQRRSFLGVLVGSISAVVGAMMAVPLFRFTAWPMFHKGGGTDWFALGPVDSYKGDLPVRAEIEVRKVDGWRVSTAKQTVYVTRA